MEIGLQEAVTGKLPSRLTEWTWLLGFGAFLTLCNNILIKPSDEITKCHFFLHCSPLLLGLRTASYRELVVYPDVLLVQVVINIV